MRERDHQLSAFDEPRLRTLSRAGALLGSDAGDPWFALAAATRIANGPVPMFALHALPDDDLVQPSGQGGSVTVATERISSRRRVRTALLSLLTLPEAARGGPRRLTTGDGHEFEIEIPAGVRDGQVIRVPEQNLRLRIRLRGDKRFRLRGDDVETDVPVAPWEAALGASVPVRTLDGTARVKVPAGSSCGRRLRLRGAGLAGGDLYAVVKIVVPKKLTRKERKLFQELAGESTFDPREGT